MNRVSAGVIVVGVAGLLAGGCANHHKDGAMGQARPKPVAETAGFDPKDPVTASATRERALALIEEAAQSPEAQSRANAMEAALLAPERLGAVISHGLRTETQACGPWRPWRSGGINSLSCSIRSGCWNRTRTRSSSAPSSSRSLGAASRWTAPHWPRCS